MGLTQTTIVSGGSTEETAHTSQPTSRPVPSVKPRSYANAVSRGAQPRQRKLQWRKTTSAPLLNPSVRMQMGPPPPPINHPTQPHSWGRGQHQAAQPLPPMAHGQIQGHFTPTTSGTNPQLSSFMEFSALWQQWRQFQTAQWEMAQRRP